jgi:hypothetical protein
MGTWQLGLDNMGFGHLAKWIWQLGLDNVGALVIWQSGFGKLVKSI